MVCHCHTEIAVQFQIESRVTELAPELCRDNRANAAASTDLDTAGRLAA